MGSVGNIMDVVEEELLVAACFLEDVASDVDDERLCAGVAHVCLGLFVCKVD